jgi:hypothetical protein
MKRTNHKDSSMVGNRVDPPMSTNKKNWEPVLRPKSLKSELERRKEFAETRDRLEKQLKRLRPPAILKVILALAVSAMCARAGDSLEKRIHEIEQKFNMHYEMPAGQGEAAFWMFTESSSKTFVPVLAVTVPKNATDKQVKDCKFAAEFAFGWYDGFMMKCLEQWKANQQKESQ